MGGISSCTGGVATPSTLAGRLSSSGYHLTTIRMIVLLTARILITTYWQIILRAASNRTIKIPSRHSSRPETITILSPLRRKCWKGQSLSKKIWQKDRITTVCDKNHLRCFHQLGITLISMIYPLHYQGSIGEFRHSMLLNNCTKGLRSSPENLKYLFRLRQVELKGSILREKAKL